MWVQSLCFLLGIITSTVHADETKTLTVRNGFDESLSILEWAVERGEAHGEIADNESIYRDRETFKKGLDIESFHSNNWNANAAFELRLGIIDHSLKKDPAILLQKNNRARLQKALFALYDSYNRVYIASNHNTVQACNRAIEKLGMKYEIFDAAFFEEGLVLNYQKISSANYRVQYVENKQNRVEVYHKAITLMDSQNIYSAELVKGISELVLKNYAYDSVQLHYLVKGILIADSNDHTKPDFFIEPALKYLQQIVNHHKNPDPDRVGPLNKVLKVISQLISKSETDGIFVRPPYKIGKVTLGFLESVATNLQLSDGASAFAIANLIEANYVSSELRKKAQDIVKNYLNSIGIEAENPRYYRYFTMAGAGEAELSLRDAARFVYSCDKFFMRVDIPINFLRFFLKK